MREHINKDKVKKATSSDKNSLVTNNNSSSRKNNVPDKYTILYNYIALLALKNTDELINLIRNYITLIFNKDSKEDIRDIFLLLAILGKSTKNHYTTTKRVYYILLKELIIQDHQLVFRFLFNFLPNYGPLINFKKICSENMIDNNILDIFRLVLNIMEEIDEQILIDSPNIGLKYDNSMLFDLNVINTNGSNTHFIEILKNNLLINDVISINRLILETRYS